MEHKAVRILFVLLLALMLLAVSLGGCGDSGASNFDRLKLDTGLISGTNAEGIRSYLGIPYAAPPVGELRWKGPQPVEAWDGVRACTEYGPACPQSDQAEISAGSVGKTDEDCLYLNVWTPAAEPSDGLPVMVWIHGGGFTTGAGSLELYDGRNLASRGVVVVTINYRLGPLGFLAHPSLSSEDPQGSSGNYGLLDQVAALEWVQRNITAFGGDPEAVTVFGESAGGISVCDLMVSPLAGGLFRRAISQSGPYSDATFPSGTERELPEAEKEGERLAAALGCADAADAAVEMRSKSVDELLGASREITSPMPGGLKFGPVIDGWALPDDPASLFAEGRQHAVPLLIGTNADEGTVFAPQVTREQYETLVSLAYGDAAGQVLALYPASGDQQARQSLERLITELGFAAQARFAAECVAEAGTDAYLYQFTRKIDNPLTRDLGSFHGLEIPYVFGNLDLFGRLGLEPGQEDLALSDAMIDYWTSFAMDGVPSSEGLPAWPAYQPAQDQYLVLGGVIETGSGLYKEASDLGETMLRGE